MKNTKYIIEYDFLDDYNGNLAAIFIDLCKNLEYLRKTKKDLKKRKIWKNMDVSIF